MGATLRVRVLARRGPIGQYAPMFVKTTRVRRGNRAYEYLSLVEAYRDHDGTKRNRTLLTARSRPPYCASQASLSAS